MIRIAKWNETFETAKTRKLVHLSWINCPTGVDSAGYLSLMALGEEGVSAFGVFIAICQWSATCRPQIRGSLARSGGCPLTIHQLAIILRMPPDVIARSVSLLLRDDVGWLVEDGAENSSIFSESPTHLPGVCQSSPNHLPVVPVQGREGKGMEGNGREGNLEASASVGKPTFSPPYSEIVSEFNASFGLQCRLTDKRKQAIQTRWRDQWWRDHWKEALTVGATQPFLRGAGSTGWTIDLEWFLKPDSITKILEGKYNGGQGKQNGPHAAATREAGNKNAFEALYAAIRSEEPDDTC